jgi:heme/copper-type cytochrome/quinol oxidase subunit 2
MRKAILALAATLALVLLPLFSTGSLAQCAMCKTTLTQSPEGQKMGQSFNNAILFLLGAPYLVFGTIAASLWYTRRRRKKAGALAEPSPYSP